MVPGDGDKDKRTYDEVGMSNIASVDQRIQDYILRAGRIKSSKIWQLFNIDNMSDKIRIGQLLSKGGRVDLVYIGGARYYCNPATRSK